MRTIEWRDGVVLAVNQLKLPLEMELLELRTFEDVAEAIKTMKIRGAPVIGVAAAYALALAAYHSKAKNREELVVELEKAANALRATRPTAVNLFWAIDRILGKIVETHGEVRELVSAIISEAKAIAEEDVTVNRRIGMHGAAMIKDGDTVLTHCNAGALATVDYGTALGV
ncbi:MAG: S-methyl-5-thioribose-1-phosphate isomerase, partial [Candidatus Bathyarchaeia archaeon]